MKTAMNRTVLLRAATASRNLGGMIRNLWGRALIETREQEREIELSGGVVRGTKRIEVDQPTAQRTFPTSEQESLESDALTRTQVELMETILNLMVLARGGDLDCPARRSDSGQKR